MKRIEEFVPEAIPPGEKARIGLEAVRLPSGMPVALTALVARGNQSGQSMVVIGGVHGDEFEGPMAILKVFEELEPATMRGTFIGLPVVNPPAFDAGTRASPLDGQNLARVFPGKRDGTVSEQIAHVLLEHVFPLGDLLLDHHSAGVKYECPLTCGFYLLDGEIGRISKEASLVFGAEVVWGSPLNHGRTISEAVRFKQIPSIYTETTGGGGVRPPDLAAYVRGTLNVMKYLGIVPGRPETQTPVLYLESTDADRDFDKAINSTCSGLIEPKVRSLEKVQKGQVLGIIYGVDGRVLEEVRSDQDGHVMGIRRFSRIFAGELVALVE